AQVAMCLILARYEPSVARVVAEELLPWRGRHSSPGRRRTSGSARNQDSIVSQPARLDGFGLSRSRALRAAVHQLFRPRLSPSPVWFLEEANTAEQIRRDCPNGLLYHRADTSTDLNQWRRAPLLALPTCRPP